MSDTRRDNTRQRTHETNPEGRGEASTLRDAQDGMHASTSLELSDSDSRWVGIRL